jgi:hypothetical protein
MHYCTKLMISKAKSLLINTGIGLKALWSICSKKSLLITVVVNAVGAVLVYVPLLQLLIFPVPLNKRYILHKFMNKTYSNQNLILAREIGYQLIELLSKPLAHCVD